MSEWILLSLTVASMALVVFHHLGYPLILHWVRRRRPLPTVNVRRRRYRDCRTDRQLPDITILVPAYNEAQWIADKIHNLAVLDYPANRLAIIIACDGCKDNTADIARRTANLPECRHLNITIHRFGRNRGKIAVINDLVPSIRTELIALSDVSALVSIDALLIAAGHFDDPRTGVLNGCYKLLNPGSRGEHAYWRYQSRIMASEAALGSTLGAHGAFYLFRRSLFSPLAADTINDDFVLPMSIVAAGYRARYEQRITALEQEQADLSMDHRRRRRIAAGNMQQLLRLKRLLSPSYGRIAFSFASGKGLRVLMPFLMLIALIGSLWLAPHSLLFLGAAVLQLLAYALAGWQLLMRPVNTHPLSQTLGYLVGGHIAGLVGALRYLCGLERGRWKRVG